MKRHFFTLLLLLLSFPVLGQNVTLEGHVVDNEKTDLISTTIRCYVDDSVFVKGTTSNSKGNFKLELQQTDKVIKLVISYIGYKELVMNIQPTKESAVRLGDIVMKKDAVQIHEVTVLGENQVRTEDKLMVYPTKEELRHAYDGYSALDALMVPELNVNTFDNTINYMNQTVLLCINGREATQDEIRDLNAKYIKRVDIYQMGKPEFPQAATVIDYIMKERDYAGTAAFNANQFFTRLEGNGRVSTQYFQDKSEFALSLSGKYENVEYKNKGQAVTNYNFPNETVTRTERFMPNDDNRHGLSGYLNYIYLGKLQEFYVSLRMNQNRSENDNMGSLQYNTTPSFVTEQVHILSKSLNPGLKLQYTRTLPREQRLRAELYGSFGNNDYDRWYEHRINEDVTDSYRNKTDEESYYAEGKINYTKTFKNKSTLNIDLNQNFTHTENKNLRGENIFNISLDKSNTHLNATYNYRIKNRFNIQARLAGHLSHVKTGNNTTTNLFFTPSFRFSYTYKKHSYNLRGQATSIEASNANRTGDEYRNNEYEITQGNPQLKDYMKYDFLFSHTWNITKRFVWMTYASFYLNTNAIYKMCEYDEKRNSLLWKVQNSGTNWQQHYEAGIQYNIIPKRFYVRTGLLYNYNKVKLWKTIYHHSLYAMGHIVYQHKGLRARAGFLTQPERIDNQTGRISNTTVNIDMSVSYSIDNWNFRLLYNNPYRLKYSEKIDLGLYQQTLSASAPYKYDNVGLITVSYRFNYGKKKHKFDNTEVIDVNQTTISK